MNISSTNSKQKLTWRRETHLYRKERFSICYHYYMDLKSGEEFTTTELESLNLTQIKNQYRARHKIPFPKEIQSIRTQYGLSAAKMSEVLDFGTNSYRLYENGEIPSLANAKLIRLAKKAEHFLEFLKEKEHTFSVSQYQKTLNKLKSLVKGVENTENIVEYIWNHHLEANEFTGFVKPNLEKVSQFILFFAGKANPLKTRMNKLLFYADFLHFKRTGYSISGCNYRAIQLGPVLSHFRELFGILETKKIISIEEELYDHGGIGERFHPLDDFDESLFSKEELNSMQEVLTRFEDIRTRKLINISHKETGWIENQTEKELIDYQKYAFLLKAL